MTNFNDKEITPTALILEELYLFRYGETGEPDIREIGRKNSWTEEQLWRGANELESLGLVRLWNIEGKFTLTGRGAVEAERRGIAPYNLASKARKARDVVISHLSSVYRNKGYLEFVSRENLEGSTGLDHRTLMLALADCVDLTYVELQGSDCRLTHVGHAYREVEAKWGEIHEHYRTFAQLTPQQRGREFQVMLRKIIELDGWDCQSGLTNLNEENDILVSREREDYLVECKWDKYPVEAGAIRELQAKLTNRAGVRGIFASMSGFTSGVKEAAEEQMNFRELLLFGPADLEKFIDRTGSFSEILTQKHKHLVNKKEAGWS
jgi:restriction endonuclease